MKKQLILTAAAASLLAGTALAQTTQTTQPPAQTTQTTNPPGSAPAAPSTATSQPNMPDTKASMQQKEATQGITMAKSASFAVRFVSPKPADVMTSKLVGLTVYNNQNDKLGEIEDLAIENGKVLTGVVVSVGGFLGLGERYVLIDPSTIVVDRQDGTWKAFVDTSKDNLKNAPQFKYSTAKS